MRLSMTVFNVKEKFVSEIAMKKSFCCFVFLVFVSFLFSGCMSDPPPQRPKPTNTPTSSTQSNDSNDYTLKGAISYCSNGQFRYTLAFKRTDGQPLTTDDKEYLKSNSPQGVAYWLKADNGVYGVACSNFAFEKEHLDALQKRFKMEDHSEKKKEETTNK